MNITDFKPGQTAIMEVNSYGKPFPKEVTVEKVGRKYVTVCGRWHEQFFLNFNDDMFLIQKVDAGAPNYLFPTRNAYEDYLESKELSRWLCGRFSFLSKRMKLDKMRRIKAIIEEQEGDGEDG